MKLFLLALLLQLPPETPPILMDAQTIPLRSRDLVLSFSGFLRTDMIEVVPGGKQEEPNMGIRSAAVRDLSIRHRERSYMVDVRYDRRSGTANFEPADVGQEAVIVITVPRGIRLRIWMDREILRTGDFDEPVFIYDGRVETGLETAALGALLARVERGEIILPTVRPSNERARVIHAAGLELTDTERREALRAIGPASATVIFEATVTDTGQVIEVRQTAPRTRIPALVLQKLRETAMRFSYEPYVIDGKAQSFTTTIAFEIPH